MPPPYRSTLWLALALATIPRPDLVGLAAQSRAGASGIPLVAGLTLVSALQADAGDREDVVTVDQVTDEGVRYTWSFREEPGSRRDTGRASFARFVRADDLRSAPRLDLVYSSRDPERIPGATAFSLSSAAFAELRERGETRLSLAEFEANSLGGLLGSLAGRAADGLGEQMRTLGGRRVYLRGRLVLVSPTPVGLSLLVNGRRVTVPTLHARGSFAADAGQIERDFYFAADSAHPLMLKVTGRQAIWRVVRVDLPGTASDSALAADLEHACRAELPGVYFEFASAELRRESAPSVAAVAALLARHPGWSLVVEGHTDSLGAAAANRRLSERRASAVVATLVFLHHVAPDRLSAVGFGAARPRETNATLEGRASNRRVEIVRDCTGAR